MANPLNTYIPKPYAGLPDTIFRGQVSNDMQVVFRSLNDLNHAIEQNVQTGLVATGYQYSKLPAAVLGAVAVISDSTVNTWGSNVTVGGGSFKVMAWYNGSHWSVIGI